MTAALPTHAQTVVIGAGVIGASVAYHLTRLGRKDVVVLERGKLGCGTTWHSAANITRLETTPVLMTLFNRTADYLPELEADTGQSVGWRGCGRVVVARSQERLTELKRIQSIGRLLGTEVEVITPSEVKEKFPIMRTDDLVGAIWSPGDGRVNATDITAAYMRGAQNRGARLFEDTPVTGFTQKGGRVTGVETPAGTIACDSVVLSAGLWSRRIALMAGVNVPLHAAEHFYMLTKPIDGVTPETPVFRDPDALIYGREEVGGLLVGCFDRNAKPLPVEALPDDFAFGLLNEDWDQFGTYLPGAIERFPALETAEIRTLLNGPESFTPDGVMMMGEAPELRGFHVLAGMNSGGITLSSSGGVLAEWMIEGEAPIDVSAIDIRRFAPAQNNAAYLRARVSEMPSFHFDVHSPAHDFREGRGLRRSPLHERVAIAGAVFSSVVGFERPVWYGAADGWDDSLAAEYGAARDAVALFDDSAATTLALTGPDAAAWLAAVAGEAAVIGVKRAARMPMTNPRGGIESLPMVARTGETRWLVLDEPAQVTHTRSWLERNRPAAPRAALTDAGPGRALLTLHGPKTAALLEAAGARGLMADPPAPGAIREIEVGYATATLLRCPLIGSWRLIVPGESAIAAYDALVAAGTEFDLRHAGHLAAEALRMEAGLPAAGRDVSPAVTLPEAGLAPGAPGHRLRVLALTDGAIRPAAGEPILRDGAPVALASSAVFVPGLGRALVMALLPDGDGALEIDLAGKHHGLETHRMPGLAA
jgi:4-methylaminobutanoate oxidase (formaldehyde-forming)